MPERKPVESLSLSLFSSPAFQFTVQVAIIILHTVRAQAVASSFPHFTPPLFLAQGIGAKRTTLGAEHLLMCFSF